MGGSSPPKPPDPGKTAMAQSGANVSTAIANGVMGNINQVTPQGNLTFSQDGTYDFVDYSNPKKPVTRTLPLMTATQTYSPQQQKIFDAQQGASLNLAELGRDQSARIGSLLGRPMDFSGAPKVQREDMRTIGQGPNLRQNIAAGDIANGFKPGGQVDRYIGKAGDIADSFGRGGEITRSYGTDFSADRKKVEDALLARMNPGLEQERSRLETQLTNQGLTRGTAAWDNATRDYSTQANDARMSAVLAGGQEQSRMVGMEADRAAFQNQAQAQGFGQNAALAQFGNQAQQQRFGQNAARAQFGNDALAQQFGMNQAQAAFGNAAQSQRFGQSAAQAAFANQAMQQERQNALQTVGFNNQARQQNMGNDERARAQWMQEQYAQRNQPLNEIASLLSGAQVQQPNFVNAQGAQMPTVDYAGLVNNNYAQQMQGYQVQQANNPMNGIMGGLFGLGSSAILGGAFR